jgi:hypothetical protein
MITRLTPRSAVLGALALFSALATISIRMENASLAITADSQEIAAAPALAGMDIPALNATAGARYLPVLAVRDPI